MLSGYLHATNPRGLTGRTRSAYREVFECIAADGQTIARAYGHGGWLASTRDEPYESADELFDAACNARRGWCAVWVSDTNHNGSLFGPQGNLLFRAHHDAVHVIQGYDFGLEGEGLTAAETLWRVPGLSRGARAVIVGEVFGQALYHHHTGTFPTLADGSQVTFHVDDASVVWAESALDAIDREWL